MGTEARSAKAAATRDQILDAAGRLIHVRGYHNTSLDDVLRESGVGKGNFYYYFKSKEGLGYAIIDRVVQAFLDRLVEIHRRRNCVGGCPMGNLASELSDVHEGFRQRLAEIFDHWRVKLADALERGRRRGRLRADLDAAAAAGFVVASLEGAILMAKVTRDIAVLEKSVAELKHYLVFYTVS